MIFACGSRLTAQLLQTLSLGSRIAGECAAASTPGHNLVDTFSAASVSARCFACLHPKERDALQWRFAHPSKEDFLKAAYTEADVVYMGMMAAQEFFPYGKQAPQQALELLAEKQTGELAELAYAFSQNRPLFSHLLKAENAQMFLSHLEASFSLYLSEIGRLAFEGQRNRMSALGMVGDLEYITRAAMLVFDELYADLSPLKAKVKEHINVRVELFQTLFRRRYFERSLPSEVYPLWKLALPGFITSAKTFIIDAIFEEALSFSLQGYKTRLSVPDRWSFLSAPRQAELLRKAMLELYVLLVNLVKTKAECFSSAIDAIQIETTEDNLISITVTDVSGEGIDSFQAGEVSLLFREADWSMSLLKEREKGSIRILLVPSLQQLIFQNPPYHLPDQKVIPPKKISEAEEVRAALRALGVRRDLSRG